MASQAPLVRGRAAGTAEPAAAQAIAPAAKLGDGAILVEFDARMRSRVSRLTRGRRRSARAALTPWGASEYLHLADGRRIDQFALSERSLEDVDGRHGRGRRLRMCGVAAAQIEKTVELQLFDRYPGVAFYKVSYRNLSPRAIGLGGWASATVQLLRGADPEARREAREPHFWCYCGSTHADRRDWVQPVRAGFAQENFMGMTAADYGGGTPVVDVWRRDGGLAVGHLEARPALVSLPVKHAVSGVDLAITAPLERSLQPGERLETPETFIATHTGDYFTTLGAYRRIMGERGLRSPPVPEAAYEPIWCAWGYERGCTVQMIEETLPKVQELALGWAVVDDGWQSNVGDWKLSREKFPRGEADLEPLLRSIRSKSLKPRLWFAPLAAAPGSDLLHDHTDMLLLDKDGAPQEISWWNSFYLCPAYEPTVAYTQGLVRRFLGEWGFAGLKVDGQHMNAVAPCFNPAHRHERPEESVERLQDLLHALYLTATGIDPAAVVEWCPCGTSYSFFNFPSMNQAPASDPESSWQVRHKGKTLKALMGPGAAYAGDHVELSDGGDDFASTVGIGAIVSTKFTWPRDPKPKDSFLLTPQKEALWRKWIALYNERQLPRGTYRGELYDIGFDRPETHVIEKSGRLYYAFYAARWSGLVSLRGLAPGRYRLRDYFNDRELGEVSAARARLPLSFERFLLLEALPL